MFGVTQHVHCTLMWCTSHQTPPFQQQHTTCPLLLFMFMFIPQVVRYLTQTENMLVVVEPQMYQVALQEGLPADNLFSFTPEESEK